MPADVAAALGERGLDEAYAARPPFQRNDYIGWIVRAKRLRQMLDELEQGGVYMNMAWNGPRPRTQR